ncbi:MAG: DUF6152 family protein [Caulobacteraceae bacterium]
MFKRIGIIAGAATLALAGPAGAHHTFAMFDLKKVVTVTGTLKDFQWTNPHIWVEIVVPGKGGKGAQWAIEGSSPSVLIRKGWKHGEIKLGQQVTVTIHPLKTGQKGGSLLTLTPAGGKSMEDGVSDGKV